MKIFSFVTLIGSLVLLLSNFLLIVVARLGYFALVLAIFLSYAVQFVLFCLVVRPKLGFSQVDGKLYRQIARYALPFLPMLIVGWILSMSDRFLLTKMLPILEAQAQNGLYGVAARFQSILTMATSVIFTTFSAFAFSSRREEGAEQSFVFVHDTLHLFLVSAAFFASLFVQDIFRLLIDSSYNAAMASVAPLLFGQVCYASHTIFAYGFAFEKKSYLNLWPTLAGALLNIILNFIFIPKYGAAAAACTTFAGYALMMCVTYLMMRRVSPMPYRFWATEGSIAAAFFLSVLFWHASFSVRVGVFVLTLGGFAILYHSSLRAGLALLKRR